MNKTKTKNILDWHYVRWGGIIAVRITKIWAKIFRKTDFRIELSRPINPSEITIMASNHQSLLDPPIIFSALSMSDLLKISPVKFMTWHKYYNSIYKLPLYTTGCFPSHGGGKTGVNGAVFFAKNGYRSFIFPEGKRTDPDNRGKVYPGITQILKELPESRLILVHLDWDKRYKLFSRPKLLVHFSDAPLNLDRTNPESIMDAIYRLK